MEKTLYEKLKDHRDAETARYREQAESAAEAAMARIDAEKMQYIEVDPEGNLVFHFSDVKYKRSPLWLRTFRARLITLLKEQKLKLESVDEYSSTLVTSGTRIVISLEDEEEDD